MTSVQPSVFDENASVSRSSVKQQAPGLQQRRSVAFVTPARKPLGNVSNDLSQSSKRPTTVRKSAAKAMSSAAFCDVGTPALRMRSSQVFSSRAAKEKPSELEDFDEVRSFEDFVEPPRHEFDVEDVTRGVLALRCEFTPALAIPAKPMKPKKANVWKSSRKFMFSHKSNCQDVDDDDYLAVREKDKEYLAGINLETLLC